MALIYAEDSYKILGACFEVYKTMGCGFLESVYQECLEIEFGFQGIPFCPQPDLLLTYKGRELKQRYRPDFSIENRIIIEIKACSQLAPEHRAQLHNYLHATKYRLGMLVNFGHHPLLEHERIVL